MCRDPPEPITGLDSATSGVKTTVPTDAGEDRSVFIVVVSKFAWFKMLNTSPRSCMEIRSLNLKTFDKEKSQFLKVGPRKMFRPILPCVPYTGGVMTVLPDTKHP